ncbi:MAG: Crp/Fnr family transcriptional regulator [Gammaproteobacteria bacterium]|nr:Crp/Fnr family transcriptional regulator [Gammaproteobacteria bacterium]
MANVGKETAGIGCRESSTADEDFAVAAGRLESGALFKAARCVHISARDIIYREGADADTVYALRGGLIKLISYLPNGRGRIVRLYGRGIWIGLESLLRQPYEHTAVAIEDVEAFRFRADTLRVLERDDARRHVHLMSKWHQHLLEADMWIADFATGPIRSRVARLLGFLSRIEDRSASGSVKLLTCEEMAAILGVTPESVSRVLAEFKRTGLLSVMETSQSELYHCDVGGLERVAWQ